MKATIAFVAAALASTINGAPVISTRNSAPQTEFLLRDGITGQTATVTIPLDNIVRNAKDLFSGTAIDQNGNIIATTAHIFNSSPNTQCLIETGSLILSLNPKTQKTVGLDNNPDALIQMTINRFNIQCFEYFPENDGVFTKVTITNEQTGASAPLEIPLNGMPRKFSEYFRGSAIDQNGVIFGTKAQFTSFFDRDTHCNIQNGNQIINLDGQLQQLVELDGDASAAIPTDLSSWNMRCFKLVKE